MFLAFSIQRLKMFLTSLSYFASKSLLFCSEKESKVRLHIYMIHTYNIYENVKTKPDVLTMFLSLTL